MKLTKINFEIHKIRSDYPPRMVQFHNNPKLSLSRSIIKNVNIVFGDTMILGCCGIEPFLVGNLTLSCEFRS